jgi:hypothetical protein
MSRTSDVIIDVPHSTVCSAGFNSPQPHAAADIHNNKNIFFILTTADF